MKLPTLIAAPIAASLLVFAAPAIAQDFPMNPGDYVEVAMIETLPGGDFEYATYLAGQWRKNQEFAKQQGWIKDYRVLTSVNPRDGEPDLYLETTFANMPDSAESMRRNAAFNKWRQSTDAQLTAESGDRTKFRKLRGTMLLQEMRFK